MNINQQTEELIDLYLKGELSPDQLRSFETEISQSSELMGEVQFQKNMVSGISNYRKSQLKSRLDAIDVGSGWYAGGTIGQNVWNIAGGVMVAALLVTGVYFYSDDVFVSNESSQVLELDSQNIYDYSKSEALEVPIPKSSDLSNQSVEEVINDTNNTTTTAITTKKAVRNTRSKNKKVKEFTPKVDLPVLEEVSDESFVSEEVSIPEVSGNDVVGIKSSNHIDVKTINKKSESIKYKYFDGKLFLYGDFKEEPYEILEINSKTAREIYLYHGQSFYQIDITDGVKELKPIVSPKLIHELTIIRNNKVD